MQAVLLLPYSVPRLDKQEETFEWIEKNRAWLEAQGIRLDFVEVGEDTRYQQAILKRWEECKRAGWQLIVMEHDEVPKRRDIRHLLNCPHLICAADYILVSHQQASWREYYTCLSHGRHTSFRRIDPSELGGYVWGLAGEEWGDCWGLGLTRFRPELMSAIPPAWVYVDHGMIDTTMSEYFIKLRTEGNTGGLPAGDLRAHIHPKVKHNGITLLAHPPTVKEWNHDRTVVYGVTRYVTPEELKALELAFRQKFLEERALRLSTQSSGAGVPQGPSGSSGNPLASSPS